jgi:putative SOS response-associated peptidase YedK
MCSRFSLTAPSQAVRAVFGTRNSLDFPPRYNIAPTQPVVIVRRTVSGEREQYLVRWGLIPSWVKDPGTFTTLINARSETAASKPSFRGSFRHKRCLVPATGFYEWTGRPGAKRPHLFRPRNGGLVALAGLADHWVGADGSELESMAILTTEANATMAPIHDRMPVIIAPEHFEAWLDCSSGTAHFVEGLLAPPPDDLLEIVDVSPKLNNPRNEGPELMLPPGASGPSAA